MEKSLKKSSDGVEDKKDNEENTTEQSETNKTEVAEESDKDKQDGEGVKPKSGGLMQKIHGWLSLDKRIDDTKNKVINRDPVTWHRLLMAIIISYVGIFVIAAFCFDALISDYEIKHTENLYVGSKDGALKLPAGEYRILGMNPTKPSPEKVTLHEGDSVVVAGKNGGVTIITTAPKDMEVPKEFYDPACYNIKVSNDNEWEFVPTEHLNKMREEVRLRQEEWAKYQKDREKQQNEAKQQTSDNQTPQGEQGQK
ncbi:MAG: hypothetical protein IKN12_01210 [Selenomonadaceae bacterium]|nr:hypothetical protein [Selenomonadaceae bacterium]